MIVVFVVDTSPSMGLPVVTSETPDVRDASGRGMSRLDLAKMAVESLAKGLDKRVQEHNRQLHQEALMAGSGVKGGRATTCPPDQFLLLSTSRQNRDQPGTAACGAGGRLLVGYGDSFVHQTPSGDGPGEQQQQPQHSHNHGGFERELKRLKAFVLPAQQQSITSKDGQQQQPPFPDDGGGAVGMNAALSAGLQLLHRYRLRYRSTENFGLGRLMAIGSTAGGATNVTSQSSSSSAALQPACLVLLTDGDCLTRPPHQGGGQLQLQFGSMPLREFYKEPFRWDQRLFCVHVGDETTMHLPSSLRALCEVTGGGHFPTRSVSDLSQTTERLLRRMAPPRPRVLPMPDPLRLPSLPPPPPASHGSGNASTSVFLNGGPVCTFQQLERGMNGEPGPLHRAMMLHVPFQRPVGASSESGGAASSSHLTLHSSIAAAPPVWCLPESYWASKKLDSLPPRLAQPLLHYSRHYQHNAVGSSIFDPLQVMKALHRLDQLVVSNRGGSQQGSLSTDSKKPSSPSVKLLHRDVYICDWLGKADGGAKGSSSSASGGGGAASPHPQSQRGHEYFPLSVRGAGRPSLSDAPEENLLHIGILHVPWNTLPVDASAAGSVAASRNSTVTLLPPDAHILLPLLVRAAEAEYRLIKKAGAKDIAAGQGGSGATAGILQMGGGGTTGKNVFLDENWRTEFRAYLFRLPPYYSGSLRRCLRPILPASAHSLLSGDGIEAIASQCFSRSCLQKIRNGEQLARDINERLERQEEEYRRRGVQPPAQGAEQGGTKQQQQQRSGVADMGDTHGTSTMPIGYGQYDPRASVSSYLAALRSMPPPWRVGVSPEQASTVKVEKSTLKRAPAAPNPVDGKTQGDGDEKHVSVTEALGDLPAACLLAYYESRRRWIFGGSGLTIKSLSVEGVCNDGSNAHKYNSKCNGSDETLLSNAGVGASMMNQYPINKMGDYRERLLWARPPVVGYGCNDSGGAAATTVADGSTKWSVDDDALPSSLFDPRTGQFNDSMQTRVATRLQVNFGNPFSDERGTSIIPEKYQHQRPPQNHAASFDGDDGPRTPPGSPPHDAFSSPVEGEDEAVFAGKKPASPPRQTRSTESAETRKSSKIPMLVHRAKKQRTENKASPKAAVSDNDKNVEGKAGKSTHTGLNKTASPKKLTAAKSDGNAHISTSKSLKVTENDQKKSMGAGSQSHGRERPGASLPQKQQHQQHVNRQEQHHQRQEQPSRSTQHHQKRQGEQQVRKHHQQPPPPPPPRQGEQQVRKHHQQPPPPPPPRQGEQQVRKQHQQPPPPPRQGEQQVRKQHQQPPPPPLDMQSPNNKPKVNLPQGWMCVWSKSQKRWYFFDTKTNKSVWQWPPPG